eukprot:1181350-Prorocentrum_minimum.AAC.1
MPGCDKLYRRINTSAVRRPRVSPAVREVLPGGPGVMGRRPDRSAIPHSQRYASHAEGARLTIDQSDAGSMGILLPYSHDGPIRRRKYGSIPTTDPSDGSATCASAESRARGQLAASHLPLHELLLQPFLPLLSALGLRKPIQQRLLVGIDLLLLDLQEVLLALEHRVALRVRGRVRAPMRLCAGDRAFAAWALRPFSARTIRAT